MICKWKHKYSKFIGGKSGFVLSRGLFVSSSRFSAEGRVNLIPGRWSQLSRCHNEITLIIYSIDPCIYIRKRSFIYIFSLRVLVVCSVKAPTDDEIRAACRLNPNRHSERSQEGMFVVWFIHGDYNSFQRPTPINQLREMLCRKCNGNYKVIIADEVIASHQPRIPS